MCYRILVTLYSWVWWITWNSKSWECNCLPIIHYYIMRYLKWLSWTWYYYWPITFINEIEFNSGPGRVSSRRNESFNRKLNYLVRQSTNVILGALANRQNWLSYLVVEYYPRYIKKILLVPCIQCILNALSWKRIIQYVCLRHVYLIIYCRCNQFVIEYWKVSRRTSHCR